MNVHLSATLRLGGHLALFAMFSLPVGSAGRAQSDPVVARAGSMYISEDEFLERFELSPGLYRRKGARLESEKLSLLYSMIAEKLLAQEALERNFDRDTLYSSALDAVARLLARDELYRQEVGRKVSVTPAEITQGMQQARTELLVRFLFCEDSTTAAFLRGRIRTAEDLDRMVPESGMGVLRDTATVVWGDADTTIERTAYALGPRSGLARGPRRRRLVCPARGFKTAEPGVR